ncbi:immunoglobulin-binding protein 1 isoform X2 [Zootermopsis nevadensis]|uniref:immunoglobulin-binding protein 1 isoform X2 n=1 Tax=Zootermopsis nevadensis TaxID=136037 RepID=UPI000B8EDCF1|nr:immunoglobulin-binding protein 1 isoform X2 [Zootermopsis nevadensis]
MTNHSTLWLNMASSEEPGEKKISQIFDEGMKIFEDVSKTSEATNSSTVQVKVKKAMRLFEEATELVSMAGIFSSNESIEEVATNNIRYFLLPALLGTLSLKLCVEDRFNVVETAEIYFRDFLRRCKSYAIVDVGIPEPKENSSESTESVQQSHAADLAAMSRQRNSKLQRYREQKQLESELEDIKRSLSSMSIVDEEVERKYYLTLIKNFAIQAVDELHSIEMEKPLLEYMAKVRKDEHFTSAGDKVKKGKFPPPKPLQPFIITKNEVQKKVFGAGYPSLPVMTVQEFYEKRVKDGDELEDWRTS